MGVMPKETITDSIDGPYNVRVGWWNDGETVQVGIEASQGRSLVSMLYGDPEALKRIGSEVYGECTKIRGGLVDEQHAELGRRILDIIEASQTSPGQPSYTGIWAFLDRAGCNRLIRVLRRARDQAYGRDE